MTEEWDEIWTMNSFAGLLTDAIAFDTLARQDLRMDFPTINRYARTAIMSAVFSLEAAANSCLERMAYPKLVVQQLDKLSVIGKYEVLFAARFGKEIDRGSRPFQIVHELFALRNSYVHPKLEKMRTRISIDEKGVKTYEKAPEHQRETSILKVPLDRTTWTGDYSRTVVKETLLFFNHFFSDLCGLDRKAWVELLSVFVKGPANTASFLATHELEILKTVHSGYGVNIKFLVICDPTMNLT